MRRLLILWLLTVAPCMGITAEQAPQARDELLRAGEQELRQGDAQRAEILFEQAGLGRHATDAELGLVRAYMQAGDYRRAVALCAHAAGAHPDSGAGAAMYAWLLFIGGQTQVAARILDRASARAPRDPVLAAAGSLLKSPVPVPSGALLESPARFAPFSPASESLPPAARPVGSGVMIDSGR